MPIWNKPTNKQINKQLQTLNHTVAKWFNQMANNQCSTRYEQSLRHNKHTHTNQKSTDKHSRHNHKVHQKLNQGMQSIYNVNLKLAFPKVASSHPHYLTFTLQTYDQPDHRFRPWPTQMTSPSHLHTQARVQQRNTYNHTYICTTQGNAPKGSGYYLRPKTHIQHTHSKHLSTRTHASTNNKSTNCMATYKAVM